MRKVKTTLDDMVEAGFNMVLEVEQKIWSQSICDLLNKYNPGVDGSGCESSDPLDVSLTEINLTLIKMQDKINALSMITSQLFTLMDDVIDNPAVLRPIKENEEVPFIFRLKRIAFIHYYNGLLAEGKRLGILSEEHEGLKDENL